MFPSYGICCPKKLSFIGLRLAMRRPGVSNPSSDPVAALWQSFITQNRTRGSSGWIIAKSQQKAAMSQPGKMIEQYYAAISGSSGRLGVLIDFLAFNGRGAFGLHLPHLPECICSAMQSTAVTGSAMPAVLWRYSAQCALAGLQPL